MDSSDSNISRITYTDVEASCISSNNLSDSSSFQYFDTSYLRGVMKPRRPAPPPPSSSSRQPLQDNESCEMIMMNDDLSTIHSELSSSDIYTTFNSSNCTITPFSIDKELPRLNSLNSSTLNSRYAQIKPQRLNNIRRSSNNSSFIDVSDYSPPPNYATYCIRNKNPEHFQIFDDDGDDNEKKINEEQKSIIRGERRSNLNIYKSNNVKQDNDYIDKLKLMNDSTFLGIEDFISHDNNNDDNFNKKKIQSNHESFRCISRMVFIFIVMIAIILSLWIYIQLFNSRDRHITHQNDNYYFDYNLQQWPNDGWINLNDGSMPIF